MRRSAAALKRYVRFHSLTRLLTFTNGSTGDGWTSRAAALDDFSLWLRWHGHKLGATPVLAVAERGGKGGRWHVHALIRSGYRLDYSGIHLSWSEFMEGRCWHAPNGSHRWHAGDDQGKHGKGFSSARVAAQYAAKYLWKDLTDTASTSNGVHRYRTARGNVPQVTRWRVPSLEWALENVCVGEPSYFADPATGEVYGFAWDSGWG